MSADKRNEFDANSESIWTRPIMGKDTVKNFGITVATLGAIGAVIGDTSMAAFKERIATAEAAQVALAPQVAARKATELAAVSSTGVDNLARGAIVEVTLGKITRVMAKADQPNALASQVSSFHMPSVIADANAADSVDKK